MDKNPNNSDNLELIKLMLESRYEEAAIHIRSYGTMLALNLAVFAAAFGYLSSSDQAVVGLVRFLMLIFGLFLAFSWWASSFGKIKGVEHWKEQTVELMKQMGNLPEPFANAVSAQFYIDGRNKQIEFEKRVFSMHLPIFGLVVAWLVVTICIGPGGVLA